MLSETEIKYIPQDARVLKTHLQATLTDGQPGWRKYQQLVVGQSGLWPLLKYEMITGVCSPMPGAFGFVLRRHAFPRLLGHVGRNVLIGRSVTVRHPAKIRIGDNVVIDDYAVLDAKGTDNDGITIGDGVMIGRNTVLSCKNGNINIGKNSNIAMNCFIQSGREVRIGANVLCSAFVYIIGGGDHRTDRTDLPVIAQGQCVRGITIEDNVLLGAGVLVQDGATVGRDAIVGSGAVVTRDIPPFAVAVGVPARVQSIRPRADHTS